MNIFNKNVNEDRAIECLKEYNTRYKNLEKSECPDFISEEDSIGVEVTVVEFDKFIYNFQYKGKTLIEYIRMENIEAVKKKTIDTRDGLDKELINMIIDKFFYKQGKDILPIQSIDQYKKLDPNTNLYLKALFPKEYLIKNQRIMYSLPSSFWIGEIVEKYIEAVKEKNQKLKHYRRFDENSLILINFTAGLEETLEFEKSIKEIEGIDFDKIFVLNVSLNNQIYEIDLRKS